jgi:hypothetical protein
MSVGMLRGNMFSRRDRNVAAESRAQITAAERSLSDTHHIALYTFPAPTFQYVDIFQTGPLLPNKVRTSSDLPSSLY